MHLKMSMLVTSRHEAIQTLMLRGGARWLTSRAGRANCRAASRHVSVHVQLRPLLRLIVDVHSLSCNIDSHVTTLCRPLTSTWTS